MKRLTPLSRTLIILLVLAALFFTVKYFLGDQLGLNNSTDSIEQVNSTDGTNTDSNSANNAPVTTSKNSNWKKSTFDYSPAKPIGGKLMGVVELGASGFNSFIINKDNSDNWEKVKYEWGNSMVVDGMATGQDVSNGLKKYIGDILDYGVSGRNIHFVVSSGARKEAAVVPIIEALKNMNYVVNEVTAEQEGQFALKSVLPPSYDNSAFVVDIGSGNTKVSWKNGGRVEAKEGPGAKYYTKNTSDSKAYDEAYKIGQQVPRNLSKTCFIIGGVPFNLAKESRNGDERFTVLGSPSDYSKLAEEKGKKVASGLNIYQGLVEGTGCNQFIFDWNANFTIGFLLALPG